MLPKSEVAFYLRPSEEDDRVSVLKFRLTYEGEIPSGQSSPGAAKVAMRESFHFQLKRLWEKTDFLESAFTRTPEAPEKTVQNVLAGGRGAMHTGLASVDAGSFPLKEAIGNLHKENGYRFIPLVSKNFWTKCSLDILFLRSDGITAPVSAGDLDNRVKTIIDALKRPKSANELTSYKGESESLFFVLLEDDDLIDGLKVEADNLLSPNPNGDFKNARWSKLVISVTITPFKIDGFNFQFL